MQKIVPNIWCPGNAAEVGEFYAGVLPQTTSTLTASYPSEDVPEFQQALAGQPLVVDVSVAGYQLRLINAGNEFRPTPALSFILNLDPLFFSGGEEEARTRLHAIWAAFADGGVIRLDLGEYPHSRLYGWVEDRFGVNWQLMLTDPAGEPRPLLIPQLLFTRAAPEARAAIDLYTTLVPDAARGTLVPAPAPPGAVLFAEFQLAGQWFSAMDGGTDHQFTFSPGVSLEVSCADQAEIDALWQALSAVPEAEQCGWLVDAFGVSWQIVPAQLGELLQRPGAYQRMLTMKKLVIADF